MVGVVCDESDAWTIKISCSFENALSCSSVNFSNILIIQSESADNVLEVKDFIVD
jgi:hypothetical protein